MGKKEDISAAITPALEALGFYLEDVTIISAGRRSMLTVIVDGDTHLSLDQVTSATKAIGEIVESVQSLGETPFTLEVTSPGLDRPLTKVRHWQKNINRLVKVVLLDGSEIKGRIKDVNEVSATVDKKNINYSDIKRVTLEIEFKPVTK
ncbi:ribosome maturation factor RimP [Candidatus Nanopelagicus abundans]|uniref:Ribosome maturation factor RimP n=1 Tax=Candidatus Nanopelagicus abundans TaxID=1884916 RepID=A0A249L4Q0_9ACTN|nr:ribosome maturation factor RimP [Candidatus Nanopelagicus abundans]ASY24078.1 ribosome maturation factor RimP [Candidatus Nanopelagicus abundans]